MKTRLLPFVALALLIVLIGMSCQKSNGELPQQGTKAAESGGVIVSGKPGIIVSGKPGVILTDKAAIFRDEDWKRIAARIVHVADKFVYSDIRLEDFDFSNDAQTAKVLGETTAQFAANKKLMMEAALRLKEKYGLQQPGECTTCKQSAEEYFSQVRSTLLKFRSDKAYYQHVQSLLGVRRAIAPDGGCREYCYCTTETVTTSNGYTYCITRCENRCA